MSYEEKSVRQHILEEAKRIKAEIREIKDMMNKLANPPEAKKEKSKD